LPGKNTLPGIQYHCPAKATALHSTDFPQKFEIMKNRVTHSTIVLCLVLISASSKAGGADSIVLVQKQTEQLQIYRKAITYNDMSTAASALVSFLNSGGSNVYQDSLAIVYYNLNNFNGAYKLANELYTANNKNSTALTLLADISGRGGETKVSLEWYEKLCILNPSPYNHYQLASKQFLLERKLECKQSLLKVIADSAEARKQPVSMEVSNGYFEQVPTLAAAYNMMGVLSFNDKKKEEAATFYNKAIAVAPEFVIAKQNLEALKPGATNKPASKTSAATKTKS
jgi:tetratricopeptide (TPR) repeat protein